MLTRFAVVAASLSLYACGGAPSPAGPSPVATAAPVAVPSAAPVARPIPAWIDPQLVGTMLQVDPQGFVRRWEGGPMHHCFGPGVDQAVAGAAADEIAALSGIPRTEAGPCNVEWVRVPGLGHSATEIHGTARAVVYAKVTLHHDDAATARHESGHVLGFDHSPRGQDLMNAGPRVDDFSADERAVVAWLFGR